ncbi:uroporphyrinogen-III synthase [Sporolactobacillus sp. THM7-4]|nr:uroporphyrinogen-III synthase [Sporolactobacillus sp. THM7-4]
MEPLLKGKRVLVTRSVKQSASMCARITAYGGEAVNVPLMKYERVPLSPEERREWLTTVRRSDWIILTSQNSLKFFMEMIDRPERLNGTRIAAVGKKTQKALTEDYGLRVDFVPSRYTGHSLLESFRQGLIRAERVAVPIGSLSDTSWIEELKRLGIEAISKVLYETKPDLAQKNRLLKIVQSKTVDAITFASPSAVRFFTELLEEDVWRSAFKVCPVAVIGSTTARKLESLGHKPDVIPKQFTALDMIDALADYFKKRKSYHE